MCFEVMRTPTPDVPNPACCNVRGNLCPACEAKARRAQATTTANGRRGLAILPLPEPLIPVTNGRRSVPDLSKGLPLPKMEDLIDNAAYQPMPKRLNVGRFDAPEWDQTYPTYTHGHTGYGLTPAQMLDLQGLGTTEEEQEAAKREQQLRLGLGAGLPLPGTMNQLIAERRAEMRNQHLERKAGRTARQTINAGTDLSRGLPLPVWDWKAESARLSNRR